MGARGARAHRLPDRDRPAGHRAWCSTWVGARRRVRLPGGDRARPRASWCRRCRRPGWRCSTPTTRWCAAMAAASRRRAWSGFGRRRRPTCGPSGVELDEQARPRFQLVSELAGSGQAPCALRLHGEHQVGNALAVAAVALVARAAAAGHRRGAAARRRGQPLADGGRRARRRRHRGQRRLQRQPRVDARRAAGARRRWPAAAGPGPCSARCASSAPSVDRRARRARPAGRRASASTGSSSWARVRAPPTTQRLPRTGWAAPPILRARHRRCLRACCRPSWPPGDVVLLKSSRDSGLRVLRRPAGGRHR